MATSPKDSVIPLRSIQKFSPVTGEKLGEFPITSPEEVRDTVQKAREAFPAWRDTPLHERLRLLEKACDVIRDDAEAFARRISEDTGKPLFDSMLTELLSVPTFIQHYKKTAHRILGRQRIKNPLIFPLKKSYIEHFPMGVIGVISPWNFPVQLTMIPAISALIAGNTVVLKPSEVTPICGEIVREIFERIGLPPGVMQVIQGDGSTGAALCEAPIDKIFFTGSVATGKKVMAAAAKNLIPVELELGGKDAFIVCHDANLKRAAAGALWGGLINCGQMCTSVERIFVVEAVYDEFMNILTEEVQKITVGAPEEDPDIGPLTFANQLDTVQAHLDDARKKGARILHGGNRIERDGQFFEPTLLDQVTPDMDIYAEETFGPVLPVIKVRDEEEAIRMANDHRYGLTGSIWTSDLKRGLALASRMESGQCSVNDVVQSVGNPVLPFGGVKHSGMGRYHGDEGLLSFTHTKAIMMDYGKLSAEPFWFPYRGKYPEVVKAVRGLLDGNLPKALFALLKMR